jgi:hypothetical protein
MILLKRIVLGGLDVLQRLWVDGTQQERQHPNSPERVRST